MDQYNHCFFFYSKFWGTCADHAVLLQRYTHAMVVCCIHTPVSYIRYFCCYSSPVPLPPAISHLALPSPNRPQCGMFPLLCTCVLIVQNPLMSENMWCLVFCSCVSLLRMMVPSFIHVPAKDMNSSFLWLHSIPWCLCTTFYLLSIDGHLGHFHFSAIMNNISLNICVQICVDMYFQFSWVES